MFSLFNGQALTLSPSGIVLFVSDNKYSDNLNAKSCESLVSMYINEFRGCKKLSYLPSLKAYCQVNKVYHDIRKYIIISRCDVKRYAIISQMHNAETT